MLQGDRPPLMLLLSGLAEEISLALSPLTALLRVMFGFEAPDGLITNLREVEFAKLTLLWEIADYESPDF
jgi:hypothetical protein